MKKLVEYKALKEFMHNFPCFTIVNDTLFCDICNEVKKYNPAEGVKPLKNHLKTAHHLNNEQKCKIQTRINFSGTNDRFHHNLLTAFIKADIPIHKINNEHFRNFLEVGMQRKINDESFYRKNILKDLYDEEMIKIKDFYCNKPLFLCFDETTDVSGRYILNILIGECSKDERKKTSLCRVMELAATNSENINWEILKLLNDLFDNDISKFVNIKLLLSDGAKYALK
ncbi:hypothetical protein ENBRE01_3319, partial [Enteropsectra breve]